MRQHPAERGRAFVARVHAWSAGLIVVVAVLLGLFGWKPAISALAGGFAVLLPQMYAAKRLLQPFGAAQATRFYLALWVYQGLKWLFTVALLGAAFFMLKGFEIYILIGFLTGSQSLWIIPLVLERKGKS